MGLGFFSSRRRALSLSTSLLALALASGAAHAQTTDIGTVDVRGQGTGTGLPVSSDAAVGGAAPAGSAPALAPAQARLNADQPGSVISDKVIRDIIPPSSDYNETAKYTPGFLSSNANGLLGDSKGGWRGFQDGQFNVTFDGIPFGDANDPTHHSAAYFPGSFLGSVLIDRGPGAASQIGYATFGGTMALRSIDLSNTFGGNVQTGFGTFNTMTNSLTIQTGLLGNTGVRSLLQYAHANTDGAQTLGKVNQDQFLFKMDKMLGDFRITLFSTYGQEQYNNVTGITYQQWQTYGKRYGAVNANPLSQQFYDYNNSQKQTDMEYVAIEGDAHTIHIDNKVYTYSYWYPQYQNNGANQSLEGSNTNALGSPPTVKVPQPPLGATSTKVAVKGVSAGQVVGYIKYNDYRAYGDILKLSHDFDAGYASGTLRTGMWVEHVSNNRLQEYNNYTTNMTFPALGNSLQASYKLDLNSSFTNYQPFIEYEWRPLANLTITPGFKYESFTRDHQALVNQTTLQPINYSATYTASMPFLAARYKVNEETTVYAQASKGFLVPTVSAYYVFNPADSHIQAQQTTNYQTGVVYKNERITADADFYMITASNFPITNTLATGETVYQNGGTARYRGLEAEGTYAVMPGLALYASAAAMDARYISGQFNTQRVGDAPDYTATFGAVYDDGMFFGSLMQKFVGGYYGSSGQKAWSATTNAGMNYVSGWNTTDLVLGVRAEAFKMIGLNMPKSAEFKLGIYNLLDHRSTTEIAGDPTGVSSPNNTALTYNFLPGRMIFGNLKINF
jgi:iron complex outermembrane receptor protein